MQRNITCPKCQKGCVVEVSWFGDQIQSVRGHQCAIGEEWAAAQVIDTRKIVTTSVRVTGSPFPMIPVRTTKPVPKEVSLKVIKAAAELVLEAPVRVGQVVARNIAGTQADLIAVKEAPRI